MNLLIHVNNEKLKRLLRSWVNPGPKHRKLRKGQIVAKLGPGALLMRYDHDTLRLLEYLKGYNPKDVAVYKVEELDEKAIQEEVGGIVIFRPYAPRARKNHLSIERGGKP